MSHLIEMLIAVALVAFPLVVYYGLEYIAGPPEWKIKRQRLEGRPRQGKGGRPG